MAETARNLATWEELLRRADDGRTYEILGGEIEALPLPLPAHGLAQSLLSGELSPPFQRGRGGPGGWWLIIEPDVRLAPSEIVVPMSWGGGKRECPYFHERVPSTSSPIGFARSSLHATSDVTAS
jgi:hypothetical protein